MIMLDNFCFLSKAGDFLQSDISHQEIFIKLNLIRLILSTARYWQCAWIRS
jgi:hypothetical protein